MSEYGGWGIELPPLNAALVKVHRELAKVSIGTKDMAIKNKNVWKTVKQTQAELTKLVAEFYRFDLPGVWFCGQLD